jgi:hypothetical protein
MLRGEHEIKRETSGIARNSPHRTPNATGMHFHAATSAAQIPSSRYQPPPRNPNLPPTQNCPQETQRNGPEPPYLMLSRPIRRRPARPSPPRSGRKRSKRTTPLTASCNLPLWPPEKKKAFPCGDGVCGSGGRQRNRDSFLARDQHAGLGARVKRGSAWVWTKLLLEQAAETWFNWVAPRRWGTGRTGREPAAGWKKQRRFWYMERNLKIGNRKLWFNDGFPRPF